MDSHELLSNMDAQVWAKEFMRIWGYRLHEVDEALMIGWFANSIMCGYDEANRRLGVESNRLELEAEDKECAMMWLDDMGVPRADEKGRSYSLVGRIHAFEMHVRKQCKEMWEGTKK